MGFIVHRIQNHAFCCFSGFAIDAWGSGHIQPFCAFDVTGIVYADKGGFVVAVKCCTGGAVRFITNNQIEFRQPVLCLRLMNDIDGVVGGVDDGHVLCVMQHAGRLIQAFGVGGSRVVQIAGTDDGAVIVFFIFANFAIGADGEIAQRQIGILRPFSKGLGKQRQAGDEKQYALTLAGQMLGNPQRSERLTRSAGHNQLAARFAACEAV